MADKKFIVDIDENRLVAWTVLLSFVVGLISGYMLCLNG